MFPIEALVTWQSNWNTKMFYHQSLNALLMLLTLRLIKWLTEDPLLKCVMKRNKNTQNSFQILSSLIRLSRTIHWLNKWFCSTLTDQTQRLNLSSLSDTNCQHYNATVCLIGWWVRIPFKLDFLFRLWFHSCLSWEYNCDDQSCLYMFSSQVK